MMLPFLLFCLFVFVVNGHRLIRVVDDTGAAKDTTRKTTKMAAEESLTSLAKGEKEECHRQLECQLHQ